MSRKLAPLAGAFLLFAAPVLAQEPQTVSAEDQAMMQAWMAYMTPGDAHAMLASHEGAWDHTVKMWQMPGGPPMEMTATSTARMTLGGRYLTEDYSGSMMGMPFEGHGITGYDNARQQYFSIWIDNMGTGVMTSWGAADPGSNTITFTGNYTDPMSGEEAPFRQVLTHVEAGHLMMEMYMNAPDGTEFKSMEIHSLKKSE